MGRGPARHPKPQSAPNSRNISEYYPFELTKRPDLVEPLLAFFALKWDLVPIIEVARWLVGRDAHLTSFQTKGLDPLHTRHQFMLDVRIVLRRMEQHGMVSAWKKDGRRYYALPQLAAQFVVPDEFVKVNP